MARITPRWLLVGALTVATPLLAFYEKAWRSGVNDHVAAAAHGFERLDKVEARADSLKEDLDDAQAEIRSMRRDQLEFYRWIAERLGDGPRAREVGRRLRYLDTGDPFQDSPEVAPKGQGSSKP